MKIKIIETLNFPPEIIFAVLTDVQHHTDWVEGVIEHISLTDSPAKLGSIWEHMSDRLGRRLLTSNECNVCETNRKFGWITGKPISSQITLSLEPDKDSTKLTWSVESEATGIAQLAEPLLMKETKDRIQKSFSGLNVYLQTQA
jgi:polyketide cyclase/dehydrase/lipid transport protein